MYIVRSRVIAAVARNRWLGLPALPVHAVLPALSAPRVPVRVK